jgi:hypothetical protein
VFTNFSGFVAPILAVGRASSTIFFLVWISYIPLDHCRLWPGFVLHLSKLANNYLTLLELTLPMQVYQEGAQYLPCSWQKDYVASLLCGSGAINKTLGSWEYIIDNS